MEYLLTQNIGFIGAGHLTKAMVFGLVNSGFPTSQIWLSNRSSEKLDFYRNQGIYTTLHNDELVFNCNIIVLSVRPNDLFSALEQIKASTTPLHLIVSVVAGIESDLIAEKLNPDQAIIRAMPNTPSSVSEAMTGLWANDYVTDNQKNEVGELFQAMGKILWVEDQSLIHSITAIAGCGPAYFLHFMEAMVESGVEMGLNESQARTLAIQTGKGAAMMAEKSEQSLNSLVSQIALPGGVTAEAIKIFKQNGLNLITKKAIQAAHQKSKNLMKK